MDLNYCGVRCERKGKLKMVMKERNGARKKRKLSGREGKKGKDKEERKEEGEGVKKGE